VTVELVAHPADGESSGSALLDNARASRERGGRRFDVGAETNTMVIRHQSYDDRVANVHVASAHVRAFDERVRDRVARRTVRIGERIDP
jgi:hypothetical protein